MKNQNDNALMTFYICYNMKLFKVKLGKDEVAIFVQVQIFGRKDKCLA